MKYNNILMTLLIVSGLILWSIIEHTKIGSFAYMFSSALILYPFERIYKEAVRKTYGSRHLQGWYTNHKIKVRFIGHITRYNIEK